MELGFRSIAGRWELMDLDFLEKVWSVKLKCVCICVCVCVHSNIMYTVIYVCARFYRYIDIGRYAVDSYMNKNARKKCR